MEVASLSISFNAGEHNSRTINVTLDEAVREKSVRLAFTTPKGRRFMSGELAVSDGKAKFAVPAVLLDGKGKLFVQAVVYENGEFCAKSRVEGFYVGPSLDEWDFADKNGVISPEDIADGIDRLSEKEAFADKRISALEENYYTLEAAFDDVALKTDPPALITSLKGKYGIALGDGQTEENGYKTTPYTSILRAAFGLAQIYNYGEDGSTVAKKSSTDTDAMCVRAGALPTEAELVTVFGGGEDMKAAVPLGTFGSTDETTFYGALDSLCSSLASVYAGKTVVFVTPSQQNTGTTENSLGLTVADYAEAVKKVCGKYSVPVYDANACGAICTLVAAQKEMYTADGFYLNDAGHALLANGLFNFIRTLPTVRMSFVGDGTVSPTVPAKSVRLNKSEVSFEAGESVSVIAVVSPSNAADKNVTWSAAPEGLILSANGRTCTVSGTTGSYVLTCTTADGGFTASCNVTVTEPTVDVQSVTLDAASSQLKVGGGFTLNATVFPTDATDKSVTWSTDSESVSLTPNGTSCTVNAVSEGSATVTCTSTDGGYTASCAVTVIPAAITPTSIRFSTASASVRQNATKTLTVFFLPSNAEKQPLVFTAENGNVELQPGSSSVIVKGVAVGTCTVTATTEDGALTASCRVTVLASDT